MTVVAPGARNGPGSGCGVGRDRTRPVSARRRVGLCLRAIGTAARHAVLRDRGGRHRLRRTGVAVGSVERCGRTVGNRRRGRRATCHGRIRRPCVARGRARRRGRVSVVGLHRRRGLGRRRRRFGVGGATCVLLRGPRPGGGRRRCRPPRKGDPARPCAARPFGPRGAGHASRLRGTESYKSHTRVIRESDAPIPAFSRPARSAITRPIATPWTRGTTPCTTSA